ncbi:MAG: hypothetical protein WD467_01360 [Candidatus Saccharimonadales bacterium]
MARQNPEVLLKNSLSNAKLNDGFIDVDTINFDPLYKIVDLKLYDSAIDWPFFWNMLITSAFKVSDFNRESRAMTAAEKDKVITDIHKLASGIPYIYKFYYQLPDDYCGGLQDLDSIKIIEVDQKRFNQFKSKNEVKGQGLAKALREQMFGDNIPKVGEKYLYIEDKGLVRTGEYAFLESNYSPDRLVGLYYSLHVVFGTLATNSIRRHSPTPRVFKLDDKYNSNFKNPLKASRATTLSFKNDKDRINAVNSLFKDISKKQSAKNKENARIQLCNALYWYLEFLNNEDWSLQLVFLVSVVDSLFPTRKHSITNSNIVPTISEKAPVIAETISKTESDRENCIKHIEKLFNARHEVIHGKIEIHGYSKATSTEKAEYKDLISQSEQLIRDYVVSRIKRFIAS